MDVVDRTAPAEAARDMEAEVVAFVRGRSAPCPRCGYDLRDIERAKCPECGEALVLTVGTQRVRFGWLVLAMAPGCFSGVAAVFVAVPVAVSLWQRLPLGQGAPWPVIFGDAFGFLSAASVAVMYRYRHSILSWPARRQGVFAAVVWGVHVAMFAILVTALAML
ncbi:MAG: hypothetical protein KF869_10580 [Phycisphaeraceae bacterium]|nr:hypothetical protein [Phycisphaeraceae bacterium]